MNYFNILNMKRITQIALLFIVLINSAHAQKVLSGEVTSKETKEPLPFATVSIKGTSIGVVTNDLGEFDLNINKTLFNDSLMISILGYKTMVIPVRSINDTKKLKVQLEEETILLTEVTISEREQTPKDIINKVIKNIKENYPQNNFVLEGFYRDYKKENDKYVSLIETALSIYDKGYSNPANKREIKENVYLNEIRKSKKIAYKSYLSNNFNIVQALLTQNDLRYVKGALDTKRFKYELENYTIIDGKWVYIIKTNAPWVNKIYIEETNYAVLQIDLDASWDNEIKNEWIREDSIRYSAKYSRKKLMFKKFGEYYYPSYMNYATKVEGYDVNTGKLEFTSEVYQELVVNEVIVENIKKPNKDNLMDSDLVLEFQTRPYNEEFWKSYNIIKETPLNREILRDLEENEDLDAQFRRSGEEASVELENQRNKKKKKKKN